jgi:hypothetical protein
MGTCIDVDGSLNADGPRSREADAGTADEWPNGADHDALTAGFDRAGTIELLTEGDLEIVGRLVEASNLNLYCTVTRRCPDPEPDLVAACVYKPIRGERPLDDFPDGTLAFREVAAYRVSEAMGSHIVPPTVLRDGPLGTGMVQLWIDVDEQIPVIDLIRRGDPALRRMALFDAVINNADRKGGHMLPAEGGHIYGVDHGVCFSPDPKLRTILWGWRGRRLTRDEIAALERLEDQLERDLGDELGKLLAPEELEATAHRVRRLLSRGSFPQPDPDRPAIPWPPF